MIAKIDSLLKRTKRSKALIIGYKIYTNWRMRKLFASGQIQTTHGSTHKSKTTAESLRYIQEQFDDYLKHSGLSEKDLRGKRILELGFGDNVGVALKFLSAGASQVICLDKFYSERDGKHQTEIYKALRGRLTEEERRRFDEVVRLDPELTVDSSCLKCIYGVGLKTVGESLIREEESFNLIVSRAVIEEIYEPDVAFEWMDKLLAPGGYMLHKIDLSDYGMFREAGMNPLTFLTIPERVYKLMASDSGIPNRKPMSYYRHKMEELGYDTNMLITDVIDREGRGDLKPHRQRLEPETDYSESTLRLVQKIRSRLRSPFRELPSEELIVAGIFLIARKPAQTKKTSPHGV